MTTVDAGTAPARKIPTLATLSDGQIEAIKAIPPHGKIEVVPLTCRIDTLDELDYFRNGGILHYVLRNLAA